ncbi:MAG: ubiquinol-cytochrome c reductase iron-sulfur subunit [Tepidisphaerales bacterium]
MSGEQADHDTGAPCNRGRRRLYEVCIGGMAVLSAGMVGFPIVSFLARPESLDLNKPLEVPLDQLSPGQAKYAEYRGQQLILLTDAKGPKIFSTSCPHLGCNVAWDSGDGVFRCPCHGAIFNGDGQVIRGPVSMPLRSIPYEVKDGKIVVSIEV